MSNEPNRTAEDSVKPELWTVRKQAASSKVKPVKLLELGENERGKFARIEFEDESTRPLYLETIEDAVHPLIRNLSSGYWKVRYFFNKHHDRVLPNGDIKKFPSLSFQSETKSKRGKYLDSNKFDVDPKPYHDAMIDGFEMAREYLNFRKVEPWPIGTQLVDMVRDLAEAYDKDKSLSEPSKQGYVVAFLSVLDEVIRVASKELAIDRYVDGRIKNAKRDKETYHDLIQRDKQEFLERMKKARLAKKLNQAQPLIQEAMA